MLGLCIHNSLLGAKNKKHLLYENEKFSWIEHIPNDVWSFTGEIKPHRTLCYDTLIKLSCEEINHHPPEKFSRMMAQLTKSKTLPWQRIMPAEAYLGFTKALTNQALDAYSDSTAQYLKSTWAYGNKVIEALQPAKVNSDKIVEFQKLDPGNVSALASFQPGENSLAKLPVYNRLATKTGRLTISNGANFTTLKKSHRKILTSRFDDGEIVYLDFSALEIRALLYEAGVTLENPDLYQEIVDKIFEGKITRKALKKALISLLYGQNKFTLCDELKMSHTEIVAFFAALEDLFQTRKLVDKLKSEYVSNQKFITNKFGRRVLIDDPLDKIFINYWAQSTGVDIALNGFSSITEQYAGDEVIPIGIIHDGMLFDCTTEKAKELKKISRLKIDGFAQDFFIKAEAI
jgi:hypothetical protein